MRLLLTAKDYTEYNTSAIPSRLYMYRVKIVQSEDFSTHYNISTISKRLYRK